ncbi:cadherin domain-containing protein [Methylobacter sp. S3L5C]|uniref:cadherin domain-containing protein n=1 Tax=Methylobacter sp. S3L5C TaxID=2839024 RepID=UPI001FAE3BBD|nr:cadherin domain-containing protein [Methylobacter sp. S3L5C]UOA08412.1 VCBS repeat-containing protein [Methylobacter sp. S3L5C]
MSIVPYEIIITQTAGNTAVTEGGATDTYTLVLTYAPTADVIISLGNTNGQVNVDFATLTFTTANWNVEQTVTVTAVNDTVGEGMHRGVIQHTVTSTDLNYNGFVIGNVIVAVTDNDMSVGNPVFTGSISNPLGLTNVGTYAAPTFVDIDGDGDLDAFIGNKLGDTLFYENTGTASLAAFTTSVSNAFGLTNDGFYAAPTFVDIDGDGDLDAFIGNFAGNTLFYQNTGTASLAAFTTPVSDAFGLTNTGSNATPSLVDIDGDGDLDAFIGKGDGNILFYENIGTASLAAFTTPVSDAFGLTNTGNFVASTLVDIDGDGDLDAFIGTLSGSTFFYENIGTASLANFAAPISDAFGLTNVGVYATPTFVDINGDGKLDALIGNQAGDTLLFINTQTTNAVPTLTAFAAALATGNEDTAIAIVFADLAAQGDEADSDGTVTAFAVKAITSGTLRIGIDEISATDWDVSNNFIVDATNIAYWTPDANANGTLNAFTVTAVDNAGAESATAIQATVDVTAAPGIIITQTAGNTAVTEEGVADTYTLVLTYTPTADVVITLGNTNGQVNVDFATLTFTTANWNTPQTVTVFATYDTVGEGMHRGVIQHTVTSTDVNYNSFVIGNVIVAVTDNDLSIGNPSFTSPISAPLGLYSINAFQSPTFVDIDSDGDLDAFIGDAFGNTSFYQNVGSAFNAEFMQGQLNGFQEMGAAAPTFVDIDGDGDMDAFIGDQFGNIQFYENIGTAISADFVGTPNNAFGLTNVGNNAAPTFVDIDGDGDMDAFIGNGDGNTLFYENTGTANSAIFVQDQSNFGLSNVGNNAKPTFVDIDGDGDLDLFIGNSVGNTVFYENIGTASSANFGQGEPNAFGLTNVPGFAAPTFVDINSDGTLDAFIGSSMGSMFGMTFLFTNSLAPVFTSGAIGSVDENALTTVVIYTAVTTDPDNLSAVTYGLGGADQLLLDINAETGAVTLKASADFESKSSYNFDVIANDGSNITTQAVVVSVNNLNDNAPVFTSGAIGSVDENALITTVIYTAVTTDADNLTSRTYTLGGDDQALLDINAETGAVTLKASANFEAKASYSFNVIAFDGTLTTPQAVVVSVNNLNDNAPVFTSGETGSVNENAIDTFIYTAVTTDADNLLEVTYSLGGTDLDLLDIDAETGTVTLKEAADFETKASYNFDVIANDGSIITTTQAVVVSVNNLNDNAPVFTSGETGSGSVDENALITTVIYAAVTTDADNLLPVTYSLGGDDQALLDINAETGAVTLKEAADFETKASYNFDVIANDGSITTTTQTVEVLVNNLNDNAPVFISSETGSVDENELTDTVIYAAVTTDADNLLPVTYSLGGDDQALLDINAETGAVTLKEAADFETKASYNFDVIANDGSITTTTQTVEVLVNNLNDNAPVFTSGAIGSVDENELTDIVIYTAVTTDADNLSLVTYSLGGDDLAWLDINEETGAVTLKEAADFETKASYNFDVIANDGSITTTTQAVVVSVLNLNDNAPTGLVTITGTAKQNQTLIAANTLADADGLGVIAYQWFANGTAINGATAESFTLGQEQVAQAITVQASYIDGADALEQVTSDASANVIALQADTAGNDSFVGSVDNSTVGYDFALADMSTNITRVGLSSDGKTVVFKGIDGTDTLTNIEDLVFGSDTISMADFLKMVTVTQLFDSLGNTNKTYAMPDLYTGPLDLDYQLIDESDNAVIIGSDSNDFIKVAGSGNKAVNSGTGNDVIDGSTGSSFLTSGEGNDTVFLDGRMAGTSWSTLTDFQQGQDHATIFGWVNGVSKVVGFSNSDGAAGYTGLTLHIQNLLPDGSAAGTTNPALNSITLTGHTLAEFGASSLADLNSQIASGTNTHFLTGQVTDSFGVHGYLYIS